jgi:radical SAM protein with 4Fe4S-binding SPASM domain
MTERAAFLLADKLIHKGIMELDILGGEPLLVPYVKDFIRYITGAGISVNISTNGSLPDVVQTLSKIPTGLLNIGFSLHGLPDTHNAITKSDNFKCVIEGIRRVLNEGKNPIVKSVLTPANRKEIYSLIHYLGELGIKRYFLLHEDIIGRGLNAESISFPDFMRYFSTLRSQLQDILDIGFVAASGFFKYNSRANRRCDAGTEKLAVLPDGSTFPCNLLLGFTEFHLGNILKDSMDTILNHPVLKIFRTSSGEACRFGECAHYATCSGGCPAHSYSFYRDSSARDPRCQFESDEERTS